MTFDIAFFVTRFCNKRYDVYTHLLYGDVLWYG